MLAAASGIPQQLEALIDESHLVALLCTRRAGKSTLCGLKLLLAAAENPGCSCLYLGLTKDSATQVMNKDILSVLNDRFRLGAKWREKDNRWELPNGSHIYLRGADANAYEINKILGQKYRVAVLDEASKYRYNVKAMVFDSLLPAMGDDAGTIIMAGTPSNITSGLFFDVTRDDPTEPGWSVHKWRWQDNIHKRDKIQIIHDEMIAANQAKVATPGYRQEWLGEWVVDQSALVYRFDELRNRCDKLPRPASEYQYLLGIDFGFTDPTALVVGAYHPNDPVLYIVYASKHPGIIVDTVASLVKALWKMPALGFNGPYPFTKMVADGAALQTVETLRQKHQLPLICAKKNDKRGTIEVLNSDLQTERIKVLPAASGVIEEAESLIWDERKLAAMPKRWEEDPRFANHELDAMLYMWREARNYDVEEEPKKLPATSDPTYGEALMWEEMARLQAQKSQEQRGPRVDQVPRYGGRYGR